MRQRLLLYALVKGAGQQCYESAMPVLRYGSALHEVHLFAQ